MPPRYPVPSPDGGPDWFHCDRGAPKAAVDASHAKASPLVFAADLEGWSDRTGVFARAQPIRGAFVRAKDVDPHWDAPQLKLFSGGATRRKSSLVPLGGSYWKDTPYPVARETDALWVSSAYVAIPGRLPRDDGDALTGSMTRTFEITSDYLRMSIGGSNDPDVGVELLVEPRSGRDLSGCEEQLHKIAALQPSGGHGYAEYVPVFVRRGDNREELTPKDLPMNDPRCLIKGLRAALRVFDRSRSAHINVGSIEPTDVASGPARAPMPVWGFADLHAHPTSYLAFGGLQGIHTIWGAPGGRMSDYVGAAGAKHVEHDIPPCDDPHTQFNAHHGGYAAPTMINAAENRITATLQDLAIPSMADVHPSQGAPSYTDFPDFRRGAHQQYHVTQIHRAYLGGLRLMSAMALHDQGLEYGVGWVRCGDGGLPKVDTTDDLAVVRAHVRAMREIAEMNKEWMQIAYSPREARDIIAANKLAVILGVEVPQLGQGSEVAAEVDALQALGIRQVILIHGMDNLLGGSAVFQDLYNTVSDWLNRPPEYRDRVETLSSLFDRRQFGASFFDITTDPSPPVTSIPTGDAIEPTEPIMYRLGNPPRIVLSDIFPHPGPFTYSIPFATNYTFGVLHPLVNTTPILEVQQGEYDQYSGGHRNKRGLTGRGAEYVKRLMERGMLIDLSHMSDATLKSVYDVSNEACGAYPLMLSHAHFRGLQLKADYSDRVADFVDRTSDAVIRGITGGGPSMTECVRDHSRCDKIVLDEATRSAQQAPQLGPGTVNRENLPREFDVASSELQQIRARSGAIGVFFGQGPLDFAAIHPDKDLPGRLQALPFDNDCAGTSKSFAAALLFANARMKGSAIGVASDYALVGSVGPRFGERACPGYLGAGSGSASGAQLLDVLLDPAQYRFDAQTDPVRYSTSTACLAARAAPAGKVANEAEPLDPYVMGQRTFDFNCDGLAQYGLVPDMLQDTANVLHPGGSEALALDSVFESANGYIEMWDRARSLSHCDENGLCRSPAITADPLCSATPGPARAECGDACPCAWNGGAPLQEVAEVDAVCDPGKTIRFPVRDGQGLSGFAAPKYTQRRADPLDPGDLTQQGDWAVYPLRTQPTWTCGDGRPQRVSCPSAANYVKVRRVLDTTVSPFTERCDFQPLPPEAGNRRVVFQCLVGPLEGASSGATR